MRTDKLDECVNMGMLISENTNKENTNTENIIKYFENFLDVDVSCIISNKKINNKFSKYKIDLYEEQKWYKEIDKILTDHNIHYIILVGFTDKIPPNFIKKYQWKIINIHPSLMPNHSGKGMYGDKIHKSVKKYGDKETGISVYFVNQEYNNGTIIYQNKIKIHEIETWQEIKSRTQDLEFKFYPKIIEKIIYGTYELHTN